LFSPNLCYYTALCCMRTLHQAHLPLPSLGAFS
jgi:hypothetical protein